MELIVLGNPVSHWTVAAIVAAMIGLAFAVVRKVLLSRFETHSAPWAMTLRALAQSTRLWLVLLVALAVSARYLDLPARPARLLDIVATIAVFMQVGMWLSAALNAWLTRYKERSLRADAGAATSIAALGFLGRLVLWSVVLLLTLSNLGVDVTALIAGLGIGGIAVALAVQNILGDLFASLSIVIDKPFVIGDFIIVDDYLGSVEYVGLKTTRVRSLAGEQIVFANSDLLNSRVRNYKRMYQRRIVFNFGLRYGTSPEQLEWVAEELRRIIEAQPLARFDRAHFFAFRESALEFEVVYWMTDPDYNKYMDTQQAINLAMMRALAERDIGFAHPLRMLGGEAAIALRPAGDEA